MYFDDGICCERCHKIYYLRDTDGTELYGLCPKCSNYFKTHKEEYLLFTGEYIKCKVCGKVDQNIYYNSEGICNSCEDRFIKHPIVKWLYQLKQKLLWLGNRFLFYLLMIIVAVIFLAIVYFFICALIGDFISVDDSFLEGVRMKP